MHERAVVASKQVANATLLTVQLVQVLTLNQNPLTQVRGSRLPLTYPQVAQLLLLLLHSTQLLLAAR
jgi:hypothetical protein